MPDARDHIEALKAAADPDRVAAALGLRGRGRRFYCPACQPDGGKTPDLALMDRGFKCHKCGAKGDLLALIRHVAGLDFPAAVAWLERETGHSGPRGTGGGGQTATPSIRSDPGASLRVKDPLPAGDPAVYSAFLAGCRPVEGPALDWLVARGVAPSVIGALGLRFCGREYEDVMEALASTFGEAALVAAGLLKKGRSGDLVPSFQHYVMRRVGFLVIPYFQGGRPVYLKVRPPVSKTEAERQEIARFMNTAGTIPCLYNVDILTTQPDRVMICEGESDTWSALSHGWPAVGVPGARNFKPAWVESFRGFVDQVGRSRVYLALDADKAGNDGSRIVAGLFQKAGLPIPLKLPIPAGMDLTDFLNDGITA